VFLSAVRTEELSGCGEGRELYSSLCFFLHRILYAVLSLPMQKCVLIIFQGIAHSGNCSKASLAVSLLKLFNSLISFSHHSSEMIPLKITRVFQFAFQ
jgi:hypothetical protein